MNEPQRHLIIPDAQVRPGVATDHIDWAAQAIVDYKPDVIVCIGDWWDFPSLNSHSEKGSKELENTRYQEDLNAGNEAFARLCAPMEAEQARLRGGHRKRWEPRKVFLGGNHEDRADRVARNDPKWTGVIGSQNCETRDFERFGFLEIVDIDGIAYSHFFANTHSGRPIGGSIENRIARIGRSFCQGHEQGLRHGRVPYPGDLSRLGIVAGSFYQHNEGYRGAQGRDEWRGIMVVNEVSRGDGCIMPLTMKYLQKKYG